MVFQKPFSLLKKWEGFLFISLIVLFYLCAAFGIVILFFDTHDTMDYIVLSLWSFMMAGAGSFLLYLSTHEPKNRTA